MKQILQHLKDGKTELVEVPKPSVKYGSLYIQTTASLVSVGTERMLIDFGKGNYLQKARQQPDKVREVFNKVRTDGVVSTYGAVQSKLSQPLPLGYCNVGTVVGCRWSVVGGQKTEGGGQKAEGSRQWSVDGVFRPGDRVVSNGPHAEYVCVPKNLCAKVPDNVSDEEAAFTVIGAIALQGVRLAEPTLGEYFVVTGLGLVGLMTVQILSANGCSVLGIDFDPDKCRLAERFGAKAVCLGQGEDPLRVADGFSKGRGVDGVIICAATKSNDPIRQATEMCRRKGRIVLTGVTGLELSRDLFFKKELSFQVSCSYGPGRYDPEYEDKGKDYPFEFVRWTEQRNFEAVLDLMAAGKLDVKPLISHRFAFENAEDAYRMIADNSEPYVGIILDYKSSEDGGQKTEDGGRTVQLRSLPTSDLRSPTSAVVGMIGAGGYTGQVLLPAMGKDSDVRFKTIASGTGVSGTHLGKKFGFEQSTTDTEALLNDPEINTVFITTRHNSHFRFVVQALEAGKHVFVEKPLCMNRDELDEIREKKTEDRGRKAEDRGEPLDHRKDLRSGGRAEDAAEADEKDSDITFQENSSHMISRSPSSVLRPLIMVGFNRRFSPLIQEMKKRVQAMSGPKSMVMTVNAGEIPLDHWTQDPQVGGGRIIGEACHFVDLLRFLAGASIVDYDKIVLDSKASDTRTINLKFADGSIGTVHYFANGSKMFPKERLEVFGDGKVMHMDNFRRLKGYGFSKKNFKTMKLWRQDKGQVAEVKAFFDAIREGANCPIPFTEIEEVMRVTLELA